MSCSLALGGVRKLERQEKSERINALHFCEFLSESLARAWPLSKLSTFTEKLNFSESFSESFSKSKKQSKRSNDELPTLRKKHENMPTWFKLSKAFNFHKNMPT